MSGGRIETGRQTMKRFIAVIAHTDKSLYVVAGGVLGVYDYI